MHEVWADILDEDSLTEEESDFLFHLVQCHADRSYKRRSRARIPITTAELEPTQGEAIQATALEEIGGDVLINEIRNDPIKTTIVSIEAGIHPAYGSCREYFEILSQTESISVGRLYRIRADLLGQLAQREREALEL